MNKASTRNTPSIFLRRIFFSLSWRKLVIMFDEDLTEIVDIFDDDPSPACDRGERLVGGRDGNLECLREEVRQAVNKRPASNEYDPAIHHIRKNFWGCRLKHFFCRLDEHLDRPCDCFADIRISDDDLTRKSGQQVASADRSLTGLLWLRRRTDGDLHVLCGALTDQYLKFIAYI